MRREHFATLRPTCPVCRAAPLAIATVVHENADDVIEGILTCTNDDCLREYPIIDGIPVIVAAIRAWLAANPLQVLGRDDLSPELESLIGDVLGPGSGFDTLRQHVGIYAAGHYESDAALHVLDRALKMLAADSVALAAGRPSPVGLQGTAGWQPALQDGPVIEIGCSVGRTTFALAERLGRITVGIDLNFGMLRVASRALRESRVRYGRRRVGVVYDRRDVAVDLPAQELVDFWCCDASVLPFSDATFALAASLNVIDIVSQPRDALAECARVLRSGGNALIATPYDWSPTATPVEHWLGGHSQRGANRGASEPLLRKLLATDFEILAEDEHVPWRLRLHERSAVDYEVHVITARRL